MSADLYAFRRNVVLVASAGTGKTHALVGVLLHALLGTSELGREPIPPSRVAATTFSRKAAAEIRERLVTELEHLAFDSREGASPYVHDLDGAAQRRGLRWSAALRVERARRALADIDAASIGTLHALAYATV
jgi:ATP-dependent helicase/nuclease subunit A